MTDADVRQDEVPAQPRDRRAPTALVDRPRALILLAGAVASLIALAAVYFGPGAGSHGSGIRRGEVVLSEEGDGPDMVTYASTRLNGTHPLWHVEPGSTAVSRVDGVIRKVNDDRFHRMFSVERVGGPGKRLVIRYRARATAIRDREGSSIIEGAKIGLRFPNPTSEHGLEDPRSAYGTGGEPDSPGSYQFLTGITERGYIELARNGYGEEGYETFENKRVGYTAGTWKDVVVVVDWRRDSSVRVRYWHGATTEGRPVYEAVDVESPFASQAGFLWLRSDDTDWEYDYIEIEEQRLEQGS